MAKFCANCGNRMEDHHNACSNCGMFYQNNAYTVPNQPVYYQNQNNMQYNMQYYPMEENIGYGWVFLGFCFPIVGWILWGVWSKERPKTALYSGIAGFVGFGLGLLVILMQS